MSITKESFGKLKTGEEASIYTLTNSCGNYVKITDFGATIVSLVIADRNGYERDVVCGYDDVRSYEVSDGYLGATVGRVCNRIAKGKFTLNGKEYTLYKNDGNNHLHGGHVGYSHRLWNARIDNDKLIMTLVSPDGDEGYPGCVTVNTVFRFTDKNELEIKYHALTDSDTPISLTNHSYFNLNGYDSDLVDNHDLSVNAQCYLPTDSELIPTGELKDVDMTPFDLNYPKKLKTVFNSDNETIKATGGFDHCFCLNDNLKCPDFPQCELYSEKTGIMMQVITDRPCVQVYTANFMNPKGTVLKGGVKQRKHGAVCLETEAMPDSPNHSDFTDIILRVGESYNSYTTYRFSTIAPSVISQ